MDDRQTAPIRSTRRKFINQAKCVLPAICMNHRGFLSAIPVLICTAAANGGIVLEQTVTGGHKEDSPVTMPSIQAGTGQTYVLAIATADNEEVTAVSGGGLTWTEQKQQCATQNKCGMRMWTAQGSPASAFQVQISYDDGESLQAVLSRYSGVGLIIDPTGENDKGENDLTCTGAKSSTAQLTLTSTYSNSVHVIGVASFEETVSSASAGYTLSGSAEFESETGYLYQKAFASATQDQFQATLTDDTWWANAGIVLNPGPFLDWRFDECSGVTASDSSSAGHDGTLLPDEDTGPQWMSRGRICGALDFDGSNDAVTGGDLSEPDGATEMTVLVWVKPSTLSNLVAIASKFDSSAETGWTMETGDDGSGGNDDVRIAFSSANYAYTTGNIFSTGQWAHWAFVYDGGGAANADRLKFYLNGQAQTLTFAGTIPATLPNTAHAVWAGATSDSASYFDGVIDEVRMYPIPLSAADVLVIAGEANYSITDLGTLPSPDDDPSVGWSVNDNTPLAIAGSVEDINDDELAWFWKNDAFTNLSTLGGVTSDAHGVNNAEQVVGSSNVASADMHAFLWDSGNGMTDLGTIGGRDYVIAAAINAGGDVAGSAFAASSPAVTRIAYRWVPDSANGITGTMTDLGTLCGLVAVAKGINDSGQVVGGSTDASGQMHPFLWTSGGTGGVACNLEMEDLGTLGSENAFINHHAQALNSAGKVVGSSYTVVGDQHGFLWVSGASDGVPSNLEMKDLGTLGGTFGWALDINDQDHVVGWSTDGGGNDHAFVWMNDTLVDLNDEVDVNTTWVLSGASAINNNEYIVGWGTNPSGDTRAFLLTPTRTCCAGGIADSTEPPLPPPSDVDSAEAAPLTDPLTTETDVETSEPSLPPFMPLPCGVSLLPLLALIVSALARRSAGVNSH